MTRRVTLAEIETVTEEDVPRFWYPRMTISKARRFAVTDSIKAQLDKTFFLMTFTYYGMTFQQLKEAQEMFPIEVKARGLKNSLVRKAAEGTEWSEFCEQAKGQNIWVFVEEDTHLKATIQAWLAVNKKFGRDARVAEVFETLKDEWKTPLLAATGGIMRDEWNIIPYAELAKYKDFPTKLELIAQIAGAVKQVPQKLAVCANQLPQKTAIGIKKIVEKMEEEGKATVGDVVA